MRGRCPREENFGDFTLKMAILSSFQAEGNRAAGMDIEIFSFAGSLDGSVCMSFLRHFFGVEISGNFPGNLHVPAEKQFPEIAQSKQGNSCQPQMAVYVKMRAQV